MSENDTKKEALTDENFETTAEKTDVEGLIEAFKVRPISSAETISNRRAAPENTEDTTSSDFDSPEDSEPDETNFLKDKSPVFRRLFEPNLPVLPKENRARLQMQSPNRLYFYWATERKSSQTLNRIFGGNAGNYTLVVKLINRTQNREEIIPIADEGSAWFDVEADSAYLAEIGFHARHRPFVRLMFSNTVETPRKNPSSRRDFSSDWTISANQFAKVLDVSGYAQDAVEVALAGDDAEFADNATREAFSQITGNQTLGFTESNAAEIRFVLLAFASGYTLENLRHQISKNLFAKLQENAEKLSAETALTALRENFGEFADETIEEFGTAVFGASSINFPRFSRRRGLPKFAPLSSFNQAV